MYLTCCGSSRHGECFYLPLEDCVRCCWSFAPAPSAPCEQAPAGSWQCCWWLAWLKWPNTWISVCVLHKKSSVNPCHVLGSQLWCRALPFYVCTCIIDNVHTAKMRARGPWMDSTWERGWEVGRGLKAFRNWCCSLCNKTVWVALLEITTSCCAVD